MSTPSQMACPPVSSTAESLDVFVNSARTVATDPIVIDRLVEIQELLGDDLAWVEGALADTCAQGPSPASDAARHLVETGGKRVRPLTALLSAACFGPIGSEARSVALVAEITHSATLLHDDVVDEGLKRRGKATSRRIYGNVISVLAGDLLLMHAIERIQADAPGSLSELLQTLRRLIDGEVVQLRGRTELDVRESTYEHIVRGKTAALFTWAARAGARASGATAEDVRRLGEFGELIGMAFQLVDDLLDYESTTTGKTSLMDLRDGKLTLPLVLALETTPGLLHAVRRIHSGEQDAIDEVARRVLASGSCGIVRERARAVTRRAIECLRPMVDSAPKRLLEGVAEELVARIA